MRARRPRLAWLLASIIGVALVGLLGSPHGAMAVSPNNGTLYFTANTPSAGKATITGCVATPCPASLVIPATITSGSSYTVAAIGANAFQNQTSITTLTLPSSNLTAIGGGAFSGATGLTSVTIPNNVTAISGSAFRSTTGLTTVAIGTGVTNIGGNAFSGANALTSITVAGGNPSYKSIDGVLFNKAGTTLVQYPAGDTSRDTYAVPGGVTTIGDSAFLAASTLTEITLPAGLLTISRWAFQNASGLTALTIPATVTSIDTTSPGALGGTNSLDSLAVEEGSTSFATVDDALYNVDATVLYRYAVANTRTSLTIPPDVSTINSGAFTNATHLTSLYFATDPPSASGAFGSVTATAYRFANASSWPDVSTTWTGLAQAYYLSTPATPTAVAGAESATISVGTLSPGPDADSYLIAADPGGATCTIVVATASSCTIGSLDAYAPYTFTATASTNSPAVTSAASDSSSPITPYLASGGFMYTTAAGETTITGCDGACPDPFVLPSTLAGNPVTAIGSSAFRSQPIAALTIPNSVTTIGADAFRDTGALATVNFGTGVQTIGEHAFDSATNLLTVALPSSVTTIGDGAFTGATAMTTLTLGSGVTTIGASAFEGNVNLTAIVIPDSVTSIGTAAFADCAAVTSLSIGTGLTTIGDSVFAGLLSLSGTLTIPNTITSIGPRAFYQPGSITSLTIPDSVTSIGDYAFYYPTHLASLTLGSGVTTIGARAFEHAEPLTSLAIPDNVTSVGECGFCAALSITSLHLGSGLTTIGPNAFSDAYALTSLTVPRTVRTIGRGGFASLTALTSLTLEEGLTTIGDYAFVNPFLLTTVAIPASVQTIGDSAFNHSHSMTSLTFAPGSQLTTIGDFAFGEPRLLTSVRFPESLTSLGNRAFIDATVLTDVAFLGDAPALPGAGDPFYMWPTSTIAMTHFEGTSGWPDLTSLWTFHPQGLIAFASAPQTPTAAGGIETATVTTSAGALGPQPTSLTITSQPGNRTCTIVGTSGNCTVTGLTGGTAYTFSAVASIPGQPDSPRSVASNAITPTSTLDPPMPTPTPAPVPAATTTVTPVTPSAPAARALPGARSRATPVAIITTFRADGPGIVTQSVIATRGRAGGRAICTVTATIAHAGPVRLVCPLTNSAKQLRVTRALRVTVSTTFRLDGGVLQRAAAAVRLARHTTPKPLVPSGLSAVTG